MSFQDTSLDPRLLRALAKRGYNKPTPVQLQCIPKILEGKDVVARARTGSGKTLAYLLPALHKVLNAEAAKGSFNAIILVPTRELCEQVKQEATATLQHCGDEVTVSTLVVENDQQLKRAVASAGQVVVSTPGRIAAALRGGYLTAAMLAARLQALVVDEADLLLSYGYEEDLQLIAPQIPRSCQCILMSATVSEDVERLQKLVLHNPITLNLLVGEGAEGGQGAGAADLAAGSGVAAEITHWALQVKSDDRLLAVMCLLRLGLVRKKVLLFVNTVDMGFRVKIFLEAFGIRAALLNAELPLNSRSHILHSFNKGLFDYLIATDDVHAASHDAASQQQGGSSRKRAREAEAKLGKSGSRRGAQGVKDEEFGVTRGIDFKGVRTIVNFDLPSSLQGYVHRVGRTGRAGESGAAITLFTPADELFHEQIAAALQEQQGAQADDGPTSSGRDSDSDDEDRDGAGSKQVLRPFTRLPPSQLEALRYRGEDVARSITKNVVREARARELRNELLNSQKLKEYFEEHSAEKSLLQHDKALHVGACAPHLRHMPGYLRDPGVVRERSSVGAGGRGPLPHHKKRKLDTALAVSQDPLKAVGFAKAPRKGGSDADLMTEMEIRATKAGLKEAKKLKKKEVIPMVPKKNVRKFQRRR